MENLTHSPLAEAWKPVKGYDGRYEVSPSGLVRSSSGKIISPRLNRKGYLYVRLHKDGKVRRFLLHVLVARAHLPRRGPGKTLVNHKDGNKTHCAVGNLEWATPARNTQHAYEIGAKTFHPFTPKKVVALCPETGLTLFCFNSVSEAEVLGFKRRNVSDCLAGKQKSHAGLHWRAA